jgi:hypothetical protein
MSGILDQVAATQHSHIRPETPAAFLSLQLVRKLKLDADSAEQYLNLGEKYSPSQLLAAYRRVEPGRSIGVDRARRFHVELSRLKDSASGDEIGRAKLLALKIERRSVAAAVFIGEHLDYTQARHLASSRTKAETSVMGFLDQLLSTFGIESVALELTGPSKFAQRAALSRLVLTTLRKQGIAVWEVSKRELLGAYGYTPLKTRKQLRQVVTGIWPVLGGASGESSIQDAVALGLHVQVERHFLS